MSKQRAALLDALPSILFKPGENESSSHNLSAGLAKGLNGLGELMSKTLPANGEHIGGCEGCEG